MWNILDKGAVLCTLSGALLFLIGLVYTHSEKLNEAPKTISAVHVPTLKISGTGVHVILMQGDAKSVYRGGSVDSVGTTTRLYLSPTQKLDVHISGTGVSVGLDQRIAPHVSITNNGTGVNVYEY